MYDWAADYIEANIQTLARQLAELVKQESLPSFKVGTVETIAAGIENALRVQIKYLRTLDTDLVKQLSVQLAAQYTHEKRDYTDLIKLSEILTANCAKLISEAFAGQTLIAGEPAERQLQSLANRYRGIHTIAINTMTSAALKAKHDQAGLNKN